MVEITYADIIQNAKLCKSNVEKSKRLDIDPRWSYYFAKSILNPKKNISQINFTNAENSHGHSLNQNINKYYYMDMAKRLVNYVESNHQMPNYVAYSGYNVCVEDYVYMFARIAVWYYEHNSTMPNYATVTSSKVRSVGTYTMITKSYPSPNRQHNPWIDSFIEDDVEKYAVGYSRNVASMRNPNKETLNDWTDVGNAVLNTEKYTSSKYTVVSNKITEPEGIAFADFGLNVPDDAYITMLRFEVKIKIDNSSTKVKSPTGHFMIYKGSQNLPNQRETGQDGWYYGTYRDYAILDLSTSWQVMTYTIYEEDWNAKGYPTNQLKNRMMGIDLVFEEPEKILRDTGVQIAWVRAIAHYIRPKYRITYDPYTTIETPLEMLVNEDFCVDVHFENTTKGNGGEQEVNINLPFGTLVKSYSPSSANLVQKDTHNYTWTVDGKGLAKDDIKLCMVSEVFGFKSINSTIDEVTYPYYIYPYAHQQRDYGDLAIESSVVQKAEPSCFKFSAISYSNDGKISYTVVIDGENQTDWSKVSSALLEYYHNTNQGNCIVPTSDGMIGWELSQESMAKGISIDWENTDNNTITFNIPEETEIEIKWSACFIPLTVGENTAYVVNGDTGDTYTYQYTSLDPNQKTINSIFDEFHFYDYRLVTKITNSAYFITMGVKPADQLMVQQPCSLKAHLWKDLAYIGCVPIQHAHYDPEHDTTNKGISETHKNITYKGKEMEFEEDTSLKIKAPPKDWTTWKGLVELDKPIPVNTVPEAFEGDVLNHRGWAEITGVKNVNKTNPLYYDGEIELDYLTHNINSRFIIEKGGKSFDVQQSDLLASVLDSGEEFALYTYLNEDGEIVTNDTGYFLVDTDGAYIYDEDMNEESRTMIALDNEQYVEIKSERAFREVSSFTMKWHSTKIPEDRENNISREINLIDDKDRVIFKYVYHDFEYNSRNEYYSCMVKAEKLVNNNWVEVINKKLYLAVDVESLQLMIDENGKVVQEPEPNYDALIPVEDETEYEIYEFNDYTYGSSLRFSLKNNLLDILDTGFNGRAISENGISLEEGNYKLQVLFKNKNKDSDTVDVITFFDFEVSESILNSDFSLDYANMYISSFPVVGKDLLFTRIGEEGTLFYFKGEDNEEFSYIQEPYYMYSGGVDLTAGAGQSIFNLNNSYSIFYMQNGLVRIGFNRLNGELYISKYDLTSQNYINVARLECQNKDFTVGTYSDDKIQIVAGTTVYTMYRGHPYIIISHPDEDIRFETTWNKIYSEALNNELYQFPVYFDLLNHDNLLPSSIAGLNPSTNDLLVFDVENLDVNNFPSLSLTAPNDVHIGEETIFNVDGSVSDIADYLPLEHNGYVGNHGTYSWGVVVDNTVPKWFYLTSTRNSVNVNDNTTFVATLEDFEHNGIEGKTIYFYEEFTPVSLLIASKSTIQTGGTSTLTVKVNDVDGNLVSLDGTTVRILEYNSELFKVVGMTGFTDTDSFKFSASEISESKTAIGTTATNITSSGNKWYCASVYGTSSNCYDYFKDCKVDFDVIDYTGTVNFILSDGTNTYSKTVNVSNSHIEVVYTGDKVYWNVDGVTDANPIDLSLNDYYAIRFNIGRSSSITYKNFVIGGF